MELVICGSQNTLFRVDSKFSYEFFSFKMLKYFISQRHESVREMEVIP
jgi:hypothetical protein